MSKFDDTIRAIGDPSDEARQAARVALDSKTKPRRSLGRLEDLAAEVAAMRGTPRPAAGPKAIAVFAGDHGVAVRGVSAYPSEVTGQMLANFARGGAAVSVLARHVGARVVVVDMGVAHPPGALPGVLDRRLGSGTADFTRGPAMSRETAVRGIEAGIELAELLAGDGVVLLGLGDMGIANTTASSALTSAFLGLPPRVVTGRGTGIDDAGYERKIAAIEAALAANRPDPADPLGVLAALGGFEIAGLAGIVLGSSAHRIPVVLDGFITSAAALAAVRLAPRAAAFLLASHRSVEIGHARILESLGKEPLLDLGMRLGEGTGAALAMSLVDASLRILHEMATFERAGVTDTGA